MTTLERRVSGQIVRWLNDQPETFAFAVTVSPYMRRGLPDIIATVRGRTLALEVKQQGKRPTAIQEAVLADLQTAGAAIYVVHSLAGAQTAHSFVQEINK